MSLPSQDVQFLDAYARAQGYGSRSAVLHKAVRLLQAADLGEDYAGAWQEWGASGEADAWEAGTGDGLAP